jgi:hypothetical protein
MSPDVRSWPIATLPRELMSAMPPKASKPESTRMSSRPEESHPRALPKPCVNLSIHTAPDVRPLAREPPASPRPRAPPVARWRQLARGLGRTTQPLRSNPITEPSSLLRATPPLCSASVLSSSRFWPLATSPLASVRQVLTFRTRARLSFAPPTCRMPLGQYQGFPRADPGGRVSPRF